MATKPRETMCIYIHEGEEVKHKSWCLDCYRNSHNKPEERERCSQEIDSEGLIDATFKRDSRVISRRKAVLGCDDFRKTTV